MTDLQRKEQFWDFMVQVRFEQEYYIVYRRKCLKITQWCKWTPKTITAIAVLLWMQWNTTQWLYSVCSIVILLMQIAELIIDKLPYESRLSDVTDLADDTLPVFRNIEAEWHRMEDDNYAFCEIPEKIREYSTQLDEIKRHYMKNDELPHEQDSITLATQKTQEYFQHFKEDNMSEKRQNPPTQPSRGGNSSDHITHSATPPTIPVKIPMPPPKTPKK